jgi:O-antigen ligase
MTSEHVKATAVAAAALTTAAAIGAGVAMLPPVLAIALTLLFLAPIAFVIVLRAPDFATAPTRTLHWLFLAAIFLYFVWPRNAYIPISALPVKHPQKILYLGLLVFFAYALIKSKELRTHLSERVNEYKFLFAAWATLSFWSLLTAATSQEPAYSFFRSTNEFISLYLLLPIGVCCIYDRQDARRLVYVLVLAACINVCYAAVEFLLKRNIFTALISIGDIDPGIARQIVAEKIRGGSYRAQASFDHPILFAEYLSVSLPFALIAALSKKWRQVGIVACMVIMIGLVLSQSRTAIVAGTAGAFISIAAFLRLQVKENPNSGRMISAILIASPVLIFIIYNTLNTLFSIAAGRSFAESSSTSSRIDMLYDGLKLLLESPLVGYGPGLGAFTLNFTSGSGVLTLDNYYLLLSLDSGIPALILLFLVLALALKRIWSSVQPELIALMGALLAFSFIKIVLGTNLNNLLLPVLISILIACNSKPLAIRPVT